MDRDHKKKLVDTLHDALADTTVVVVTHQTGMTVQEVTELRRQMRAAGANFRVTKNRLAQRALAGTKCEQLKSLFKGPTAIAFSRDPVAVAKVATDYAKATEKLVIAGGALFIVLLAETSRIPVDNRETHLELTMIHEAMLLETS